jgi:hypothetical protein
MRIELLFQFVVPLTFLAIWALTSLLNREAEPLPPRPTRRTGPDSGGGGGNVASRTGAGAGLVGNASGPARYLGAFETAGNSPLTGVSERKPTGRLSSPSAAERPGGDRLMTGKDSIVVLDPDARGSMSDLASSFGPRSARPQASRRSGRSRSSSASAAGSARPAEAAKTRALTGLVNQSLAETKARPLQIAPLAGPLAPISAQLSQSVSASVTGQSARCQSGPAVTGAAIRSRLADASQLREMAVLSEILQPPLALRSRRRR